MNKEYAAMSGYTQTAARFKRLGIEVPTALSDGMAALKDNEARAIARLNEVPQAVDRVALALLTETDPMASEQVRRDCAVVGLASARIQVGKSLEEIVDRQARSLMRKHLPALIEALAVETTRRGEHVAAAREVMPSVDMTKPVRPQVAAQHLTTWAVAREAVEATPVIVQAWVGAHEAAYGRSPVRPGMAALIVADVELATMEALGQKPGSSADHAVAQGLPLDLADLDVFLHRCDRLDAQRAEAERERQEKREKASYRSLGTGSY